MTNVAYTETKWPQFSKDGLAFFSFADERAPPETAGGVLNGHWNNIVSEAAWWLSH